MYDAVPIDAVEDGLAAAAINGGYRTSDSDKVEAAIAYARDRSPRFVAFRGFNPSDYVVSKELRYHFAKDSPDLSKASALLDDDLRQFLGDPAKAPTNSTSTTQPGDPSIFQSVCSLDIDASVMNKPEYVSVDDFEISLNEAASTLNDLKPAEWKQRVNELIGYQADYRSNYRPYVVSPPPKNPVVVPLLVTDDLQAAIQSQSVEQVRQLAISLAAMAGQANIQGGLNALDDQLRKSLGRSLNSTFTLARGPADNTIRARFGASQQAGSTFSMIPAAHNVTLLVLVPRIYIDSVEEPQIHLESETTFVESSSGQEVESVFDPDASKDEHVIEEVNDILRKNLTSEDFKKRSAYRDFGKFVLLAAMDNDFDRFQELLGGPEVSLETTWTELLELCEQSTHGYATVRLPRPTLPKLEPDVSSELVSADDDTKKSTTVAVVGTGDLFSSRISGELQVTTRPSDEEIKAGATTEPTTIVASSVAVLSDGRTIQFTFPSLAASNFVPKNHLPPELALRVHFYHQDGTPFIFSDPGAMESSVDYQTCVLRYVSEQPVNLPITLSVHAKVIDAKSDGTGSIIVDISGFPASGKVGSYFLAVEGADLESAGLLNTDGASFKSDPPSIDKNVGMIPISGNGVMSLSLKNLNPVANVTISATDSNGNKLESPIVLIVDRATNSSAGGTTTAPSK